MARVVEAFYLACFRIDDRDRAVVLGYLVGPVHVLLTVPDQIGANHTSVADNADRIVVPTRDAVDNAFYPFMECFWILASSRCPVSAIGLCLINRCVDCVGVPPRIETEIDPTKIFASLDPAFMVLADA